MMLRILTASIVNAIRSFLNFVIFKTKWLTMPINITEEPNILINLPNTNFQETLFAGQEGISFCLSKHS